LRDEHAHRRLGFAQQEVASLLEQAGLEVLRHRDLAPSADDGGKLTVSLWLARDPRVIADPLPRARFETA
jgi:demethylmenaquinone methyltransferase/2-methoxy-6-polyprenyl-1,4-benzoquinol methylase/ArsR family transcriptional regulator